MSVPVRMSEIGRVVWFFGKPYIWVNGGAGLCLVRMPGWWGKPEIPLPPAELPWGC